MKTVILAALILSATLCVKAQESPYFVTYDHHTEDKGDLELEVSSATNVPRAGQRYYFAPWIELEYGITDQWTTSLYLEGQATWHDSTIFTGYRVENRFRPFKSAHWINPVLYLEYENISEADRIQKEIEGAAPDVSSPNSLLRRSNNHELETKLILSRDFRQWNVAGNFIAAKNFSHSEGIEFGYSVGFSRGLGDQPSRPEVCRFCRSKIFAGVEVYGGLGSTLNLGGHDTAHYVAPVVSWLVSNHTTLRFSPGFGLTHESSPVLFRFGYTYEFEDLFRGRPSSE
jgi:hypothetical protein